MIVLLDLFFYETGATAAVPVEEFPMPYNLKDQDMYFV